MLGLFKRRRRQRWRAQPWPEGWAALVAANVPYWHLLVPAERAELAGHTQVLLHEKYWEGCGGLALRDELRVTIAVQAGLLLLNRETDYFSRLSSILVYPARYVAETERRLPDGTVVGGPEVRAGESWYRGAIVLSWDDARHGATGMHDGYNVVLHEFAHQLDAESGAMDGTPLLPGRAAYAEWARVCQAAFEQLRDDLRRGRPTVLRPYGATSPAEFFAVATETFFERPRALRERHPALYAQLNAYYRQDPVRRGGHDREA